MNEITTETPLLTARFETALVYATQEAIRYQFGERVASIVDSCTQTDIMPKPPWRDRKLQYLEKLRYASPEVLQVSIFRFKASDN